MNHLGRSEDYVNIIDYDIIQISPNSKKNVRNKNSNIKTYIPLNYIESENIYLKPKVGNALGTIYYLPKNYIIQDNKRKFERIPVLYASNYFISKNTANVYIDNYNNYEYLICFI